MDLIQGLSEVLQGYPNLEVWLQIRHDRSVDEYLRVDGRLSYYTQSKSKTCWVRLLVERLNNGKFLIWQDCIQRVISEALGPKYTDVGYDARREIERRFLCYEFSEFSTQSFSSLLSASKANSIKEYELQEAAEALREKVSKNRTAFCESKLQVVLKYLEEAVDGIMPGARIWCPQVIYKFESDKKLPELFDYWKSYTIEVTYPRPRYSDAILGITLVGELPRSRKFEVEISPKELKDVEVIKSKIAQAINNMDRLVNNRISKCNQNITFTRKLWIPEEED